MRRDACNLIHIVSFDVNSLLTLEAPRYARVFSLVDWTILAK